MRCPVPGRSRRQFLQGSLAVAGLGFLGGCGTQPPRPPRSVKIGVLAGHGLDPSPEGTAFRAALRDLGYIERRNLTLIVRTAGLRETLSRAAAELVGQGVDVLVTVDDEATRAARDATDAVPIVMADSSDPVRTGLIASLGRPGGNVTGLTSLTAALGPKRLELLRAAVPGVARVAFLWAAHAGGHPDLRDVQAAAQRMGVRLVPVEAEEGMNMAVPLAGLNDPVDGVMVFPSPPCAWKRCGS